MEKIYLVADRPTFLEYSIDLKKIISGRDKKNRFIHDGNALYLHVFYSRSKRFTAYRWMVRIHTLKKSEPIRRYEDLAIGGALEMTQDEARAETLKIFKYVNEHLMLPELSDKPFLVISDSGERLWCELYMKSKPWPVKHVSDDFIKSLTLGNSCTELYRLSPTLYFKVAKTMLGVTRLYCYRVKCGDAVAELVKIAPVETFSVETAYTFSERLDQALSIYKRDQNKAVERCKSEIENLLKSLQPEQRVHTIPQKNRGPVLDASGVKELFKSELSQIANLKSSFTGKELTLGQAYNIWKKNLSASVSPAYLEGKCSVLERYFNEFFETPLEILISHRIFAVTLLKLSTILSASVYERAKQGLNQILDHMVSYGFIAVNPVRSIHNLNKSDKNAGRRLSLDPFNLKNDLYELFGSVIFTMPLYWRTRFELLFATLLRCREMLSLSWDDLVPDEVTGKNRLIVRNTKTLKDFHIPVTDYMQALLEQCREFSGQSRWIFPLVNDPERPAISQVGSFSRRIRAAGCGWFNPHGARSAGADFFAAHMDEISYETGMAALQHKYTSDVQLRYDRTFMYKPRIKAMRMWNDFLQDAIGEYSVLKKI